MVRRAYTQRNLVEVFLPDADKLWDPTLRREKEAIRLVLLLRKKLGFVDAYNTGVHSARREAKRVARKSRESADA